MASSLPSRIAFPSHIHSLLGRTSHPRSLVAARSFSLSSAHCSRRKNASSTSTTASAAPPGTKQTKNPFLAPANSVLAYVGPYAGSLRQCKSVAFVFGACGCIAIPSTLFLGNTEHLLAVLGKVLPLLRVDSNWIMALDHGVGSISPFSSRSLTEARCRLKKSNLEFSTEELWGEED